MIVQDTPILWWSIWGSTPYTQQMLAVSVASFRRFFGKTCRYRVFADDLELFSSLLGDDVEVMHLPEHLPEHDVDALGQPMWRKWAPGFRLDVSADELRIDADFFLISEPLEILQFFAGEMGSYLVGSETFPAGIPYGNFIRRIDFSAFVPVNAGLVGQKAGMSLQPDIEREVSWLEEVLKTTPSHVHDEQGAIALALQDHIAGRRAHILDAELYPLVRLQNLNRYRSIESLCGMHAVDSGMHVANKGHIAFDFHRAELSRLINLPSRPKG